MAVGGCKSEQMVASASRMDTNFQVGRFHCHIWTSQPARTTTTFRRPFRERMAAGVNISYRRMPTPQLSLQQTTVLPLASTITSQNAFAYVMKLWVMKLW